MSDYRQRFDAAYSVSDIHLGGERGFQIFNHGNRLKRFIDHLTALPARQEVVLVLNGDVIDSLAEPHIGYVALDEAQAVTMIERIMDDPSFSMVFDALAAYVTTARRHLVVVAGNHDIELGLPAVEAAIRARLAGGNAAAQSRLVFSGRGAGYSCRVGEALVVFTHGNELDGFNQVDNEKLGQLALAQNSGRTVDPDDWTPNMGTRLVVDIMNDIKKEYPFIDLLKPETAAVVGVLNAMGARESLKQLEASDAWRLARSLWRTKRVSGDLLNLEVAEAGRQAHPEDVLDWDDFLGPHMRDQLGSVTPSGAEDDLLLEADRQVIAHGTDWAPSDDARAEGTLGWRERGRMIKAFLTRDRQELLRNALLDWRDEEGLFGPDAIERDDRMSKWLAQRPTGAHFTVAGHTHKARSIKIRPGRRHYLNSGTWIRILELPKDALDKGPNWDAVWKALDAGSLKALDDARLVDGASRIPILMDFTTAVKIEADGNTVMGELLQVGRQGPPRPVPDSQRTVVV